MNIPCYSYGSTRINHKSITCTSIGYAGEDALNDANSPTVVSQGSASSLSDYVSGNNVKSPKDLINNGGISVKIRQKIVNIRI